MERLAGMPLDAASILQNVRSSAGVCCALRAVMDMDLCGLCGREGTPRWLFALDNVQVRHAL